MATLRDPRLKFSVLHASRTRLSWPWKRALEFDMDQSPHCSPAYLNGHGSDSSFPLLTSYLLQPPSPRLSKKNRSHLTYRYPHACLHHLLRSASSNTFPVFTLVTTSFREAASLDSTTMAGAISRRRVKASAAPPAPNHLMSKFGRISKNTSLPSKLDKKKVLAVCLPNSKAFNSVAVTCIDTASDEESHVPTTVALPPAVTLSHGKKRKAAREEEAAVNADSPVHKRCRTIVEAKSVATSEEGKKSDRNVRRSKKTKKELVAIESARAPDSRSQLPDELSDLLDLQRAILKTVMMQISHQNNNTPIDISAIAPQVSRTWGKRNVTVDDIRRCIAIQDIKSKNEDSLGSPFMVADYGRGKLCLEIHVTQDSKPIDQNKLCKQFEQNLHTLRAERAMDDMSDLDLSFESLSVSDLPKSEITLRHQHVTGTQNPLLAKGQRALAELKQGIAIRQQEKGAKATTEKISPVDGQGAKLSLLDRLRAKEAARAQLDVPSGPEMARKRALQRVGDVASIIGMLASSSNPMGVAVLSFTMPVLQQKLKDSLRVPMPIEEGIDTVRLLANEVAPGWLKVVQLGGKEHVVIQTRGKPYDSAIVARVNSLLV